MGPSNSSLVRVIGQCQGRFQSCCGDAQGVLAPWQGTKAADVCRAPSILASSILKTRAGEDERRTVPTRKGAPPLCTVDMVFGSAGFSTSR